jgi:hypothetical protein
MGSAEAKPEITEEESAAPQLFALTRSNALGWTLMPEYLCRVQEFYLEFDPRSAPDFICQAVMREFISADPQMFFPVVLREGRIVGHGLIEIFGYDVRRYATVTQMKFDEPLHGRSIPGLVDAGLEWAKAHGCSESHAFVQPGPHERWLKLYGFRPKHIVMSKDI